VALALMHLLGQGGERDEETAANWFAKAAAHGNARAQYNLALLILQGDQKAGNASADASPEHGLPGPHDAAMFRRLASFYELGEAGTPNMIEAARWYRAAAEAGHADAQFSLGRLYARGEGLSQQLEEAARWFEKAAEQGVAAAQVNIAAFQLQGTGTERDPAKAANWYRLAARQGLTIAMVRLAFLYRRRGVA
jgi:uncharacterized protein